MGLMYKVTEVHSALHQYWMLELTEAPRLGKRDSTTEKRKLIFFIWFWLQTDYNQSPEQVFYD